MKNSGSRRVARYFSGRYFSVVTAAGVRSNIFDTTLLLPSRLASMPRERIRSAAPAPAAAEASGRGRGAAASGLGGGRGGRGWDPGEFGHRSDAPDRGTRDRAQHRRTWTGGSRLRRHARLALRMRHPSACAGGLTVSRPLPIGAAAGSRPDRRHVVPCAGRRVSVKRQGEDRPQAPSGSGRPRISRGAVAFGRTVASSSRA